MLVFLRQAFRGFALVTLCALLIPVTVFAIVIGAFVFLPLPANLPEARAMEAAQGSQIFDINGEPIAELRQFDLSIPVQQEDIPEVLKHATVASEDKNFYKHKGIDPRGIMRALYQDYRNDKVVQGGSTITQQYVKLAYTNREQTITRKIREAILASQLDRQSDKDEILYKYLSSAYFGEGAYGVGAAAQLYFQKNVKDLNASEAAILVGIIPSPSAWSPHANPEQAEARRLQVLQKMHEQGYLDKSAYDDAVAHPMWLERQGDPTGPVTLVKSSRAEIETKYPYFVDYVKRYLELNYGTDKMFRGGLKVQTTLDPAIQGEAERIVAEKLKGTSAPLQMAMASVEPQTGFVKAIVGGRDLKSDEVNYALGGCPTKPKDIKIDVNAGCWNDPTVTGGGSGRQPGSSFKPIVLAAAYESGISPNKVYPGGSVYRIPNCKDKVAERCQIRNDEGHSSGATTVKSAMASSLNTVYAPLGRDVGFPKVAQMANKLGMDDYWYSSQKHTNSGTYSLGVVETSPLKIASAYGVFANRGVRQEATPVVKIVDMSGKTLEDNSNREGKRVISEAVADNVTDALEGVITRGTAANTGNIGRPAAGKTGTTENFGDAWFVGYTPSLSTAVWMGNSTNNARINYKGNRHVYGGTVPTQTWAAFMKSALKDVPPTKFEEPAPIAKVNTDALRNTPTTVASIQPAQVRQPRSLPSGKFDETTSGIQVTTTTTTAP